MTNNEQVNGFLIKLIEKTKHGEIRWDYLDNCARNRIPEKLALYHPKGLLDLGESNGNTPYFDIENSFSYIDGNTTILLYTIERKVSLAVVPTTLRNLVLIEDEDYKEALLRLLNIVKSLFPSAESYIDSFK
jgi:hypothetical protein